MSKPVQYMSLSYEDYKTLEDACLNFKEKETVHTSHGGFYHTSFRIELEGMKIEFHGPLVKAAEIEEECQYKSPAQKAVERDVEKYEQENIPMEKFVKERCCEPNSCSRSTILSHEKVGQTECDSDLDEDDYNPYTDDGLDTISPAQRDRNRRSNTGFSKSDLGPCPLVECRCRD